MDRSNAIMTEPNRLPAVSQAAGEAPNAARLNPVEIIKRIVFRILRQRRLAIGVCFVLAFASAVSVALLFTARSWESKATLLYSPLPVPETFSEVYHPPKLSHFIP